jgi:outer membrane protein W
MRLRDVAIAGFVVLAGVVSPAWAETGDVQVRFGVVASMPTDDLTVGAQKTELDDAFGVRAGVEYRFRDSIGIAASVGSTSHDVEVTEPGFPDLDLGEIDLVLLTVDAHFHFLADRGFDLYAGPTLGNAFWGDIEVPPSLGPGDVGTDDELVYGGVAGLDVPFGESGWAFASAARVLFAEVPPEGSSEDIGVDPIEIMAGVSYTFGRRP